MIYLSPQQIKNIKLIQTGFKPKSFFNKDYDFITIYFHDARLIFNDETIMLKFNRIRRVNGNMIEYHSDPSYLEAKEYIREILKSIPKEKTITEVLDNMLNETK